MKNLDLKIIYYSLNEYEKEILQQNKEDFEHSENIKFINLYSYISHLASSVRKRQSKGEFIPRNMQEAQAGCYL